MNTEIKNPFLVSGYAGENYFCNRKKETDALLKNVNGNLNTTLFAIRRVGKTGLVKHVFHKLERQKKALCIYTDIFATKNLREFTNTLATAIYNKLPENRGLGKKITEFIKRLRPVISYDPLTGSPEVSVDFSKNSGYEKTIQQLFEFLNSQNTKIVIAIDEFQQITHYPEKNTEAFLRTHIQSLKNTVFIFCGSNHKLMYEMFNNAKRPFYASCANMNLDYIKTSDYAGFISKQFAAHRRKITPEAIEFILEWTYCHTYYTQFLCNRLYESAGKNCTLGDVLAVCEQIHNQEEGIYYQYRNMLTQSQWNLLKAVAIDERIHRPNGKDFIHKHKLGAISSINRSIESLLEKELIHKAVNVPEPYYMMNDKFLMRWLQRK
ncbi:MAG: ATP-binding protein [Bacteroidia bacterium]|nr:ATP-binding protein [Bacteroidia bacterium]